MQVGAPVEARLVSRDEAVCSSGSRSVPHENWILGATGDKFRLDDSQLVSIDFVLIDSNIMLSFILVSESRDSECELDRRNIDCPGLVDPMPGCILRLGES